MSTIEGGSTLRVLQQILHAVLLTGRAMVYTHTVWDCAAAEFPCPGGKATSAQTARTGLELCT